MLPFRILPRPSLLTGAVVATSIAGGLAAGILAGGFVIVAAGAARRL